MFLDSTNNKPTLATQPSRAAQQRNSSVLKHNRTYINDSLLALFNANDQTVWLCNAALVKRKIDATDPSNFRMPGTLPGCSRSRQLAPFWLHRPPLLVCH